MTEDQEIIRIAAKGDGVSTDGRHYARTAPGDTVKSDGTIVQGPHHVVPLCRHFGTCGGCQLQHLDEISLAGFVTDRVVNAAAGQAIEVGELLPTYLSPRKSRRRATMHAMRVHNGAVIGFREAGSHRIVDLKECHVVAPEIFAAIEPLRSFVARHAGKGNLDIELTLVDQGIDCSIRNLTLEGLAETEAAVELAQSAGFARLSINQGYGAETMWEPEPATVTLSGVATPIPAGSFLQATRDAEDVMVADALAWSQGASTIADLFSGLGTFSFALAKGAKVLAVEAAREQHLACKTAAGVSGRPVHAMHRDLFRNPLMSNEIGRFDSVVLDPPRAGAKEQVGQIAASDVSRVIYISCNPSSWAKDARKLVEAGFRLEALRPVGQFRWSTHVELTSYFTR